MYGIFCNALKWKMLAYFFPIGIVYGLVIYFMALWYNLWLYAGLPDFSWYKIPKRGKIYQMTTKCTKWPLNISNSSKKAK
jgi:hypothetical protein